MTSPSKRLKVGDIVGIKEHTGVGIVIAIDKEGVKVDWISAPQRDYYRGIHSDYDYYAGVSHRAGDHLERFGHVDIE